MNIKAILNFIKKDFYKWFKGVTITALIATAVVPPIKNFFSVKSQEIEIKSLNLEIADNDINKQPVSFRQDRGEGYLHTNKIHFEITTQKDNVKSLFLSYKLLPNSKDFYDTLLKKEKERGAIPFDKHVYYTEANNIEFMTKKPKENIIMYLSLKDYKNNITTIPLVSENRALFEIKEPDNGMHNSIVEDLPPIENKPLFIGKGELNKVNEEFLKDNFNFEYGEISKTQMLNDIELIQNGLIQ